VVDVRDRQTEFVFMPLRMPQCPLPRSVRTAAA
jgi:hypothetical protein